MIIDCSEKVTKPLTLECWHFFCEGLYVGAVWQEEDSKLWMAFCTAHISVYGNIGHYKTKDEAKAALAEKIRPLPFSADRYSKLPEEKK